MHARHGAFSFARRSTLCLTLAALGVVLDASPASAQVGGTIGFENGAVLRVPTATSNITLTGTCTKPTVSLEVPWVRNTGPTMPTWVDGIPCVNNKWSYTAGPPYWTNGWARPHIAWVKLWDGGGGHFRDDQKSFKVEVTPAPTPTVL